MQIIYIVVATSCLIFFITSKRRVDFFTFAFVSSFIYFFPGFFGAVRLPSIGSFTVEKSIIPGSYIVFCSVLITLTFGAFLFDKVGYKKGLKLKILKNNRVSERILLVFAFLSAVLFFLIEANELFSLGKPDFGRTHAAYQLLTGLGLAFLIGKRKIKLALLFFIMLIIDLYGGNREGLALALLSGLMLYIQSFDKVRLIGFKRVILSSFLIFFVFVIYKEVYRAIKLQNWELVMNRVGDITFWMNSIKTMEPFTTQNILNQTIDANFTFSFIEWIRPIFHNLIIFSDYLGARSVSFGHEFTQKFYPFSSAGLASNFWAEGYAVGGYLLVLLLVLIYSLFLPWIINRLFYTTKGVLQTIVVFAGCYFFFFVHRTGLPYMFTIQKRIFVILILIMFFTWFISEVVGVKSKVKKPLY